MTDTIIKVKSPLQFGWETKEARIKQTGEIFTPTPLVQEILDKLPEEVWTDPTKTFLDPSAGDGQFLVQVLLYKLSYNHTVKQALSTIYGVELMEDNTQRCRERLIEIVAGFEKISIEKAQKKYGEIIEHNIVCHDALTWDFDNWCSPNSKTESVVSNTNVLDQVCTWE